jgi:dephospho-CoA kinase
VLNVGLTGNIGAGKSTVARLFAGWGALVIDADSITREVQQPGSPALAAIAERFGADVLGPDGSLDRAVLRERAMRDQTALADLEAIVHPAVQRRRAELMQQAAARGARLVVNDIPLLFEVLDPADFDLVVLVDAPPELRRERIMAERGLPPGEADSMIAAQMPSSEKRARSGVVIDNAGSLKELEAAAWAAWCGILERAGLRADDPRNPPGAG